MIPSPVLSTKQAEFPDITDRITALAKASALGHQIQQVEIEPSDLDDGTPYLAVRLTFDHTDDLKWHMMEPLIVGAERSLEGIDDRFPSVRLADAA